MSTKAQNYSDFILPVSTFAVVEWKRLNGKFTATSDQAFYVIITDVDIKSLKSLGTLFDKYLGHMLVKFEQNLMVQNIQNLELFGKNG